MGRASYARGDIIISEGSHTSEAYILEQGSVEVYRKGPPEFRLAVLRAGDTFGEMALITEQPRSASVRALEDVEVSVFSRDEFLDIWRTDPDVALAVIRLLCERMRALTTLVTELSERTPQGREAVHAHLGRDVDTLQAGTPAGAGRRKVLIEGLTSQAQEGLGGHPISVERFPYRIGRVTRDPLVQNELAIPDREPFAVSRNHCAITCVETRCFVIDRGSRLGTVVNGALLGGGTANVRAELREGDNEVVLGDFESPYRFRFVLAHS